MSASRRADDDAPLFTQDEDKLGFSPFAKDLAQILWQVVAPEGLVFGLHGVWGSGKTSLLNLLVDEIRTLNAGVEDNQKLVVVRFEPWLISGHQDLIASYFKVLTEELPSLSAKPSGWLSRFRKIGGSAGGPLIDAAAKLGTLYDPTVVGSTLLGKLADNFWSRRVERWKKTPSLQEAHRELVEKLRQAMPRIVVLIDDVDRLTDSEIRDIMQLVKSVGRLPHITYLLAYDKGIVWSALAQQVSDGGNRGGRPQFAEKIIQHELELPRPSQNDLFGILDSVAGEIMASFDTDERFRRIIMHGLMNWINTPRDAVRLGNALAVAWTSLGREIDPRDIIAAEALRLFDYDTFNWIKDNREYLVDRWGMLQEDEQKKRAADIFNQLQQSGRVFNLEILAILFPGRTSQLLGNAAMPHEPLHSVASRGGIGTEEGYDTYFGRRPPQGVVPKSAIDQLSLRLDDRAFVELTIKEALGQSDRTGEPLVSGVLRALYFRMLNQPAVKPTPELLRALMNTGDAIVAMEWTGRWFTSSAHEYLTELFREMVKQWGGEKAVEEFRTVVERSSPLMSSFLLMRLAPQLAEHGADPRGLLTQEQSEVLRKSVEERIRRELALGDLLAAPVLWPILAAWERFARPGEIRRLLVARLESDPAILTKLPVFRTSSSNDGLSYSFNLTNREQLYDRTALSSAAQAILSDTNVPEEVRKKAEAVIEAMDWDNDASTEREL